MSQPDFYFTIPLLAGEKWWVEERYMRRGEEQTKEDSWDFGDTEKEMDDLGLNYGREDRGKNKWIWEIITEESMTLNDWLDVKVKQREDWVPASWIGWPDAWVTSWSREGNT